MVNSGFRQYLYWGNEAAYGSAATINKDIGLVQSVNPTETNNLIKVRTLGGSRDYSNIVPGRFEVNGSFEFYVQNAAIFRQAFGEDTASTATVDSGPKYYHGTANYLHVLGSAASPGMNDFPSFSLEFTNYEDDSGTYNLKRLYTGCRINTLSLTASVDEPLRATVDFIAQGVTAGTGAPASVTESTEDPFVFYQGAIFATSGTVTGETSLTSDDMIAEVNSLDFSIDNNLEPVWYVSGTTNAHQTLRTLKELVVKGRDYDTSLNLHFKNKKMYERFLGTAGATKSQDVLSKYQVVIDLVKSGSIGGTTAATDKWMRLVLQNCAFDSANITGAPEDIVSQMIDVAVEKGKFYVVDDIPSYK